MACGFSATAAGAMYSLTGCTAQESAEAAQPTTAATVAAAQPAATATSDTAASTNQPAAAAAMPTDESTTAAPAKASTTAGTDLAIARGSSPTALVQAALAALGGIEAFVKPGDDVIIKPNIVAADYSYEYAAYTNPEVFAAVTALCVGAGAGRVRVMDRPSSSTCAQVYARSGIGTGSRPTMRRVGETGSWTTLSRPMPSFRC